MPRLLLVRHGLTEWNAQGRIQGHTETALSEVGRRQVEALAKRLATERIDAIYSSDLGRALYTAEVIAQYHGLPIIPEPRLRESNYGAWEGYTMEDILKRDPERATAWLTEPVTVGPPGGETLEEVAARVDSFLQELRARPDSERILLVGHGGSLRALLALVLHVPQGYSRRFRIDAASLSIVDLGRRVSVVCLNDCHHIADTQNLDRFIVL